jgi:hypothetical protein
MRVGLFDFLKPQSQSGVGGTIGHFGLEEWWLSAFTEGERKHILSVYQPMGSTSASLVSGSLSYTSRTPVGLLWALAGWFSKPQDRPLAHQFLAKAEELAPDSSVLDRHFLYSQEVAIFYKDRDDPAMFDAAIDACQKQIDLGPEASKAFLAEYPGSSLPSHRGFEQLSIIREKQGDYQRAIALSEQAQSQGWSGDWENRIERCRKKHAKA